MRLFLPHAQSILIQSGHTLALVTLGVMAMAMAPAQASDDQSLSGDLVAPPVRAVAEPAGPVTRAFEFSEPVPGRDINSPFGMRRLGGEPGVRLHKGVDIAAPRGTAVLSAAEATVVRIGHDREGYGAFIELSHPNGMTSFYAHLSRIDVASGDRVSGGERIGLVGSTGYSTGPHLHFEIRREGEQVNPTRVIGRSFQIKARG